MNVKSEGNKELKLLLNDQIIKREDKIKCVLDYLNYLSVTYL